MIINKVNFNELIDLLNTIYDNEFWLDDKKPFMGLQSEKINQFCEWYREECEEDEEEINLEYIELLQSLIGYKIKVETDGVHKHDGQLVSYKFTFKNKEDIETIIDTEMCSQVGFNYHGDVQIA